MVQRAGKLGIQQQTETLGTSTSCPNQSYHSGMILMGGGNGSFCNKEKENLCLLGLLDSVNVILFQNKRHVTFHQWHNFWFLIPQFKSLGHVVAKRASCQILAWTVTSFMKSLMACLQCQSSGFSRRTLESATLKRWLYKTYRNSVQNIGWIQLTSFSPLPRSLPH